MTRLVYALAAIAVAYTATAEPSRMEKPGFDDLSRESRRTIIVTEYEELASRILPHLNYIKASTKALKGGQFLYVSHRLFGRYEFDAGPFGPGVAAWVSKYQWHLQQAGISRVGFRTDAGEEGWYTVPGRLR